VLALATAAAYSSSFGGVFVNDDVRWIVENEAIRQAWPPWAAAGGTLRPVLFWSLALNYAVSGLDTWSYHAGNLLIHLAASLVLFGLLRRALTAAPDALAVGQSGRGARAPGQRDAGQRDTGQRDAGRPDTGQRDTGPVGAGSRGADRPRHDGTAFAAALIWALHPLQTQAVTYVIQRGESLAGLLLVLVLYCAYRGAWAGRASRVWYGAAAAAFYLGLGTKEVMVVALPVLWVFDRLFLSGGFRAALAQRRGLYAALAGPLAVGGALAMLARPGLVLGLVLGLVRGDAVDVTRWQYLLAQPGVILQYLRLCVWPFPQYLDYGWTPPATQWGYALPGAIAAVLLGATAWAVARGRRLGFAGAWFFLILAPTSSFVPLKDLLVEHRMYLPLAAVCTLAVLAAEAALARQRGAGRPWRVAGPALLAVVALGLGAATWRRNLDYHSELALWGGAAAGRADNAKRFYNLGLEFLLEDRGLLEPATFAVTVDTAGLAAPARQGLALLQAGRAEEAVRVFEAALAQAPEGAPDQVACLTGAGIGRFLSGDAAGARRWLARAVEARPLDGSAHTNLSCALLAAGDTAAAAVRATQAVHLAPRSAEVQHNAGTLAALTGDWAAGRRHLDRALALRPGLAAARNNLGAVRAAGGDLEGALAAYELAADQGSRAARANAGLLLLDLYRRDEAVAHLVQAAEYGAHRQRGLKGLCVAEYARGDLDDALAHGLLAVELGPRDAEAHNNTANCYLALGDTSRALALYRKALSLARGQGRAAVHHNLARARFALGSPAAAADHLEQALALRPADRALQRDLAAARQAE